MDKFLEWVWWIVPHLARRGWYWVRGKLRKVRYKVRFHGRRSVRYGSIPYRLSRIIRRVRDFLVDALIICGGAAVLAGVWYGAFVLWPKWFGPY